jgi:hypothetical protein
LAHGQRGFGLTTDAANLFVLKGLGNSYTRIIDRVRFA